MNSGYDRDQIFSFDNGSMSEIKSAFMNDYPGVNYKKTELNTGFAGGFNKSLNWVFNLGFDSALFLTNDTVVDSNTLRECELTAGLTGAHILAPTIRFLKNPEIIDATGGYFDFDIFNLSHYRRTYLSQVMDKNFDYAPGTALWLKRECFEKLGGVDEDYFMFWEDADFCVRARKEGFVLARAKGAYVGHGGGQTTRKKTLYTGYYYQRNRMKFCDRFLSGKIRNNCFEKIRNDLDDYEKKWNESNYPRRMEYMRKLRQYFQEVSPGSE